MVYYALKMTVYLLFPIFIITGINIQDGEVYPASFVDKGPDKCVRHARIFGGIRGVSFGLLLKKILEL